MSLLRYELEVKNFDGDTLFIEDFNSINKLVKIARCFDSSNVILIMRDLIDNDRYMPIYEFIEVMR